MYLKQVFRNKWIKRVLFFLFSLLITSCSTERGSYILLFSHNTPDERQFHLMREDGTQLELLASVPYELSYYGLSPDGTKLAMGLRTNFLTILDVPSGKIIKTIRDVGVNELHELAEKGNIVSWSPNGNQLVFLREISAIQGVELVLYDTLNDTQLVLTADEALYRSPAWSPDGQYLAAAKMQSCGLPPWQCSPEANNWDIVVFDLKSQTSQQITHFENIAGRFQNVWSKSLCGLKWSPTGDFILFENGCSAFGQNEGKEVFVVSREGVQLVQLTDFDYDDSRYIVRYTTKWLASDNQLFVAYSIMPMMPPSYGLVAQHGFDIYQQSDFNQGNRVVLDNDDSTYHPIWATYNDGQFFASVEHESSGCRQLIQGNYDYGTSELTLTPKSDWPLLATYSDILTSSNGSYLAYLTTGEICSAEDHTQTQIVLADLEQDQITLLEMTAFTEEVRLLDWIDRLD
ncbi:MAG: PD40 domain-containing protein [Anaerolineae bacterium]|nr:PD40 domain-containing protein [Anaerolineae bacterium]